MPQREMGPAARHGDRAPWNVGLGRRGDLKDWPKQELRHVRHVRHQVPKHAQSRGVAVEPPRQLAHGIASVHGEEPAPVVRDRPETPVANQRGRVLHHWCPSIVEPDPALDTGVPHRIGNRPGFRKGPADRFLAKHMLAR